MKRFLVLLFFASTALAQAPDPLVGRWEMNRERSKFQPPPGPQTVTLTVVAQDKGLRYVAEGLAASGGRFLIEYTAYFDGHDWPITGWSRTNAASYRRIDARTIERVDKYNRTYVQTVLFTVSADDRELTVVQKAPHWHNVIIYERK